MPIPKNPFKVMDWLGAPTRRAITLAAKTASKLERSAKKTHEASRKRVALGRMARHAKIAEIKKVAAAAGTPFRAEMLPKHLQVQTKFKDRTVRETLGKVTQIARRKWKSLGGQRISLTSHAFAGGHQVARFEKAGAADVAQAHLFQAAHLPSGQAPKWQDPSLGRGYGTRDPIKGRLHNYPNPGNRFQYVPESKRLEVEKLRAKYADTHAAAVAALQADPGNAKKMLAARTAQKKLNRQPGMEPGYFVGDSRRSFHPLKNPIRIAKTLIGPRALQKAKLSPLAGAAVGWESMALGHRVYTDWARREQKRQASSMRSAKNQARIEAAAVRLNVREQKRGQRQALVATRAQTQQQRLKAGLKPRGRPRKITVPTA